MHLFVRGAQFEREGMARRGDACSGRRWPANRRCEVRPSGAGRSDHAALRTLEAIQRRAFGYFLHETNRANGLVRDKTRADWPASIAAVGLALTAYPVGVERGFIPRAEAAERTLTTLRFFWRSRQGPEPDAAGYKGFYYHFLDMQTCARAWQCELSTVDSALLLGGMLTAAAYFDGDAPAEHEIRAPLGRGLEGDRRRGHPRPQAEARRPEARGL